MRTFAAAAEAGSFTAAAERLGISKKLVSKYVGQLEDRLDVRLFHRTTRRLSLTEAGHSYFPRCVKVLEDLDALEHGLKAERGAMTGRIRLTAPVNFGSLYVRALIQQFRKEHPNVHFDLRLSDTYVDLADGGYDLAVRIGQPEDSSYVARRLAPSSLWTVAAPGYLDKAPALRRPQDLHDHECILDTNLRSGAAWPYLIDGRRQNIQVSGPVSVNSPTALREFVLDGAGVGLVPDYVISADVADGRLLRLLPEFTSAEMTVQALYLNARYMPARLRAFIDFLAASFRNMETWQDLLYRNGSERLPASK